MKVFRAFLLFALLICYALPSLGQDQASWKVMLVPEKPRAGEHAQVVVTATIKPNWYIYSLNKVEDGPIPTSIKMSDGDVLTGVDKPIQPNPHVKFDEGFQKNTETYEGEVAFGLPVKLKDDAKGKQVSNVEIVFQACKDGSCTRPIPVKLPINYEIEAGEARAEYAAPITTVPKQPAGYGNYEKPTGTTGGSTTSTSKPNEPLDDVSKRVAEEKKKGILNFLLFAFGSGLIALLTPCVFPMIPITVSFFTKSKQKENGKPDLKGAIAYCLGIIGTFTILGLALTAIFGPLGIRNLATNPWVNLGLGALFVVLAANLFGAFEIILPSWLLDKAQAGQSKSGILGPLMMGFAFTLTSFTCTVAFVGTLLAAAAQGDWFYPTLGMLAFSTAFALPFFLLALFPQYLNKLPRSGSWMVAVKAFMGFLELAAALKFLSNIDLYFGWGLITRPIFLAIWGGLGVVSGLYLWGWLRLAVDNTKKYGISRRIIGGLAIAAGIYCLAGMNGASMGGFEGFMPPEPYPYKAGDPRKKQAQAASAIPWIHSYQEGLAKAKAENKPLFINFTGVQCTNCRDMERNILPREDVRKELDKFVVVELYTDQSDSESVANAKLQDQMTRVATLPVYTITTPDGKPVKVWQDATKDVPAYIKFLQEGYNATQNK